MNPFSTPSLFYIDSDAAVGVPDSGNGETKLDPNAAISTDHINLTNAGYAAVTSAYLSPQDTWQLNDGDNDPTALAAADTATNATNPYLANNPQAGQNPATLTGNATWTTDPTRGGVLTLSGGTGAATTTGPVLNTAASFTVSAWVNLATLPTGNATIAAQDGTVDSPFFLQYNHVASNSPKWALAFTATDTTDPHSVGIFSTTAATTGWTHLVGTYNATTHTAQLYINGTLASTTTNVTTWAATGPFTIGRGLYDSHPTDPFPGMISNVQAWNYTLTPTQITALNQQIS